MKKQKQFPITLTDEDLKIIKKASEKDKRSIANFFVFSAIRRAEELSDNKSHISYDKNNQPDTSQSGSDSKIKLMEDSPGLFR